MKLLLNTHCSNEFVDACSYAFLDLTPELASLILKRAELLDTLRGLEPDLMTMEFYGCQPMFLDRLPDDPDGDPMEIDSDEPFAETELPQADFIDHAAATECDRMVIGHDEVCWTCYPKHGDFQVETRPIDYNTARRAAGLPEIA